MEIFWAAMADKGGGAASCLSWCSSLLAGKATTYKVSHDAETRCPHGVDKDKRARGCAKRDPYRGMCRRNGLGQVLAAELGLACGAQDEE